LITSVSTADAGKEPSAYVETAIAARLVGRGLTTTEDVELIMLYGVCVDKVAVKPYVPDELPTENVCVATPIPLVIALTYVPLL
jgi:hypothetical protein